MRIKKNDYVIVVAGNAKGEKGHVKEVLTDKGQRDHLWRQHAQEAR